MKHHYTTETFLNGLHVLPPQIEALKPYLSKGDAVHSSDGELIGYYSDDLSGFFNAQHPTYSYEQWTKLIKAEPSLVVINRYRNPTDVDYTRRCYATRTLISSSGKLTRQVLVSTFNEPAWINIGHADAIESRENHIAQLLKRSA